MYIFENSNLNVDEERIIVALLNTIFRFPMNIEIEVDRELLIGLIEAIHELTGLVGPNENDVLFGMFTKLFGRIRKPANMPEGYNIIFNELNTLLGNIYQAINIFNLDRQNMFFQE
jgi:hypothetical protein